MEELTHDVLMVRGQLVQKGRGKYSSKKSKLRGRYKSKLRSLGPSMRRCLKHGKVGHYDRYCKSKAVESKIFEETQLIEGNDYQEEKGDVYLDQTNKKSYFDSWLVVSSAYYHMTSHREWLREYEKFGGVDVLLGDDSLTNIFGWGKFQLTLKDGMRGTLLSVLHILGLDRNLIFVSKMGDVEVHIVFDKYYVRW